MAILEEDPKIFNEMLSDANQAPTGTTNKPHEWPPNRYTTETEPHKRPPETEQVHKGTSRYCQALTGNTCQFNLTFKLVHPGPIASFAVCMFCSRKIRKEIHKLEEEFPGWKEQYRKWKKDLQDFQPEVYQKWRKGL